MIVEELTDQSQLDKEIAKLQEECDVIRELIRRHIEGNARSIQNQEEYQQRYGTLAERYEATHRQLGELSEKKQDRTLRRKNILRFMADFEKQDTFLTDFNEDLWIRTVESVTVHSERDCCFKFRDGSEVHLRLY